MTQQRKSTKKKARDQFASLGDQGQRWKFLQKYPEFERPQVLLDPPLEITIHMLRGLRMMDETIVVHGNLVRIQPERKSMGEEEAER